MVIISVIKTTKHNQKTESKSPSNENEQKTNHEFNNFATHYHMLISKHIHVNKQIYFFSTKLLHKVLSQTVNRTNNNFFFSPFRFVFSPKKKTKNQYKINTSKTIAKMKQSQAQIHQSELEPTTLMHIFYSFIFVHSQAGEKENRSRKMKREMMFLKFWKTKTKSLPAVIKRECQMVGAYFDLESGVGFGDQIQIKIKSKGKTKQKHVQWRLFLKQYDVSKIQNRQNFFFSAVEKNENFDLNFNQNSKQKS